MSAALLAPSRVASVRERLESLGLAAMLVTATANVRYVTGFHGVFDDEDVAVALITSQTCCVVTDSRYGEAARRAASGTQWEVLIVQGPLLSAARERLEEAGVASVGLESTLPYRRFRALERDFSGRVECVDGEIERLREVKETEELARIVEACELVDRAFDHALGALRPGAREIDIALEAEIFMRRNGSDGVAFPCIVASGPHSSMPHARVTQRELSAGDVVLMDFGARVRGYCSDLTRTVVVGSASGEVAYVYEAVLAAQDAAVGAARAGVKAADLDGAARAVLDARSLGDRFGHALGHGVGLDVHEAPSLASRNHAPLRAGSVVTVEPGVYLEGRFGVRIEDCIVLEDGGCRVLTRSPKALIEVS